jgi:hypothetical protein
MWSQLLNDREDEEDEPVYAGPAPEEAEFEPTTGARRRSVRVAITAGLDVPPGVAFEFCCKWPAERCLAVLDALRTKPHDLLERQLEDRLAWVGSIPWKEPTAA